MMTDEKPFEQFCPDPFARKNPFRILGSCPRHDNSALSARGAAMRLRVGSPREELVIRDALRELSADPIRRADWEVFTPHVEPVDTSAELVAAGEALGQLLLGGEPLADDMDWSLQQFAGFLNWDRKLKRRRMNSVDHQSLTQWWRAATHFFADRWEYWHQLALLYHRQATLADEALADYESSCSRGESQDPTKRVQTIEPGKLGALWLRTCECWMKTLDFEEFWETIRGHTSPLPGFGSERFERLRTALVQKLVEARALQLESAVQTQNRLAAARQRRLLEMLITSNELPPFSQAARTAVSRLVYRLWHQVHQQSDCRKRFDEIASGLLLVAREDMDVVMEALDAMMETGANEQVVTEGTYQDSMQMAQVLSAYVDVVSQHVFPEFPNSTPLNAGATRQQLFVLQWYYGLRLEDPTADDPGKDHELQEELKAALNQ